MISAQELVNRLLEEQLSVTVEYAPASIDSMPHVIWMIRAKNARPSQYLDKGTAHSLEQAKREVDEKIRLTGAKVVNVIDRVQK